MRVLISLCLSHLIFISAFTLGAQTYAPPVGQAGTTAIYKDSSVFINWASACNVIRGYQDISNPTAGYASAGDSSMALGIAGSNGVVSLGDGGSAICTFQYPIKNGSGFDFAVFENSFDDNFLELALVEVSSDGINYVRFPSHSLTDTTTQTGSFGYTDATKINNLAGKYRGGYGTPFDLQELATNPNININSITHVKVIDVVGSVNRIYAKRDSYNNIINDPWPTPFASGGFDLDAIGVINQNTVLGLKETELETNNFVYPNPVKKGEDIIVKNSEGFISATVFDFSGELLFTSNQTKINTINLSKGIYFLQLNFVNGSTTKRIIVD